MREENMILECFAYTEIAIPNVQARDNISNANNHHNQKRTIQKRRLALSTAVEEVHNDYLTPSHKMQTRT